MSKLRIFIEGKELDSLESVTVPITKQFEELSDPTVICNDYSKTVTVPLSKNNNEIFGHCYNPDRLIAAGDDDTPLVGIYFDPYKKLDCRLQWGDDVFFTGYAKMLKVTNNGYEVTINGELGKIFQELQKINIAEPSSEDYIDLSMFYREQFNSALVVDSFNNKPTYISELVEKTDENYNRNNIIAYTFNPFKPAEQFDNDNVLNNNTIVKITDILEAVQPTFETDTKTTIDSISDVITPMFYKKFLAESQIPCIPVNVLFLIFKYCAKQKNIDVYYDPSFFTEENKPYANMAMTLNTVQYNSAFQYVNLETTIRSDQSTDKSAYITPSINENIFYPITEDYSNFPVMPIEFDVKVKLDDRDWDKEFTFSDGMSATIKYRYLYKDNTKINVSSDYNVPANDYVSTVTRDETNKLINIHYVLLFSYSDFFTDQQKLHPDYTILQAAISFIYEGLSSTVLKYPYEYTVTSTFSKYNQQNIFITDHNVTIVDFWNNEVTLFDVILQMCKLFRIHIIYEDNKLKFLGNKTYFSDISVINKTNKINKTTFDINPLSFGEYKYVDFKFDEPYADLATKYEDYYKLQYGAKRLTTSYNFNDATNEIVFKNLRANMVGQLTYYSLESFIKEKTDFISIPGEVTAFFQDEDNCYENTFGVIGSMLTNIIFNGGIYKYHYLNNPTAVQYGNSTSLINPAIVDYSTFEQCNIISSTDSESVIYYFSAPLELYYQETSFKSDLPTLYDMYWKDYIDERYNIQNKKVTTYIKLTPQEFINFKFNQFWKIGNQIYIVNKIYDYDITSDKPTKVDLITVQNIEAYKN